MISKLLSVLLLFNEVQTAVSGLQLATSSHARSASARPLQTVTSHPKPRHSITSETRGNLLNHCQWHTLPIPLP